MEIDISLRNRTFTLSERFYPDDLIEQENRPENWQMEVKIKTIEPYLIREYNGHQYVMLHGVVD